MKYLVLLTSALIATGAWGQTHKELDITMSIVEEQDTPGVVLNRIALPPPAPGFDPALPIPATADPILGNALDGLSDQLHQTTDSVLDSAAEIITSTINDSISLGDLENLPGDIVDKLPVDIIDDLLPLPIDDVLPIDGLLNDLTDLPSATDLLDTVQDTLPVLDSLPNSDALPNLDALPQLDTLPDLDSGLDSALNQLEQGGNAGLDQVLPNLDPVLPDLPAAPESSTDLLPLQDTDLPIDPVPGGNNLLDGLTQPLTR